MRKICIKCNEEKDIECFSKKGKYKGEQKYQSVCKECAKIIAKKYRELPGAKEKQKEYDRNRDKEANRIRKKKYVEKNREKILEKKNIYNNLPEVKERNKKWREENKKRLAENMDKYRERYPMVNVWRSMLHRTLNYLGKSKYGPTEELLGYSANELKEHLNNLLLEDMNWLNYGTLWEIDHIRPLTSFPDDSLPSEVNALSNLRPLYKTENIQKGNKY